MLKIIASTVSVGALAALTLAGPIAPATASTTPRSSSHIKPGKSCPNPKVWNKPVHTKKFGWLECKLDKHGSGWHFRHIHNPNSSSMPSMPSMPAY